MTPANSTGCLLLAAFTWMPHMIVTGHAKNPKVTGTMLEILNIFAQRLGFCYRFMVPDDPVGGARLPNGSWTGIMNPIFNKKVDFSGQLVMINAEKAEDFDVSEYLYIDEHSAAYIRPILHSDIKSFIKPYNYTVWSLIFLSLVIVGATYFLLEVFYYKALPKSINYAETGLADTTHNKILKNTGMSTLYETGFWTIATLLSQPMSRERSGESLRIISSIWLLISFVIGNVYRSNLMAMMILPKVTLPFDNLEQLIESKLPVWTATHALLHIAAINMPNTTTLGKLSKQFICVDGPANVPYAVRGLVKGDLVIAGPLSGIYQIFHSTFSTTGKCINYVMSENFLKTAMASLVFPKGSPWKAKLDPIIVRLRESGLLNHIYSKGIYNATECLKPVGAVDLSKTRSMDLKDFYGVFILYMGGLIAATMSFLLELLFGKHNTFF